MNYAEDLDEKSLNDFNTSRRISCTTQGLERLVECKLSCSCSDSCDFQIEIISAPKHYACHSVLAISDPSVFIIFSLLSFTTGQFSLTWQLLCYTSNRGSDQQIVSVRGTEISGR